MQPEESVSKTVVVPQHSSVIETIQISQNKRYVLLLMMFKLNHDLSFQEPLNN